MMPCTFFWHDDPVFIISAIAFTANVFANRARLHGLVLNFGNGKTEAILSLRGPSAKALRQAIEALGSILTEEVSVRVVCAYKHLGTTVTSTACPSQDAARRVSKAVSADASVSGQF